MLVKVVVAAANENGAPDFFICRIECYAYQYKNGEHYDEAKEAAADAGYDGPMVVFDEHDGPAFLFEHFNWGAAIKTNIREQLR